MSRRLLAVVAAALVCAAGTGASARERRSRPVRKVKAPGRADRTTPLAPTTGGNALQRGRGTVYRATSAEQHRPRAGSPPPTAAARAHADAVRAHAWAYAARLRRTGQTVWAAMFGVGVALGQLGVQVGKSLSGKPLESFLDTVTSPHVIVAGLIPTFLAVLVGEVLKRRYIGRAETIEASVQSSHQADHPQ